MTVNAQETWLVTGAASGIGAAVVRAVRQAGHQVLALDVNDVAGQLLASETGAIYRHCNVADPADWEALGQYLTSSDNPIGIPDRVHLNAGVQIAGAQAPLSEFKFGAMTLERYRRLMGVNVDGVVFGLQALLPLLESRAVIVVTASLAGITPYGVDPLYAMSKHAVVGLVRSLGPDLRKRGITIHALCPGGIDTPLVPEAQKGSDLPFMTPEHIADEVMALMNESETGKTWAKVSQTKPLFIVRAPGDKGQ